MSKNKVRPKLAERRFKRSGQQEMKQNKNTNENRKDQ